MSFVTMFNLMASLAGPIFIGYAAWLLLFRKTPLNIGTVLAISFGLGMGIIAQWMLVLSMFGLHFSRENVLFPLIILLLISLFFANKKREKEMHLRKGVGIKEEGRENIVGFLGDSVPQKCIGLVVLFYIVFQIYFIFWRALNIPIYTWDALYVIASKAKCFFYEGSIASVGNYNLASYPLQTPLSLTWVALNLGMWEEQLIKIMFPIVFLCYLILHYTFLRYFTNKLWALLGVGLFLTANFPVYHATVAYRDIFLMYYNISAIMFLVIGYKIRDDRFFILSGLFSGFAIFTKLEATGYFFIHCLVFIFLLYKIKDYHLRDKFGKLFKFIIPSTGIYLLFYFYKATHQIAFGQGRFHFNFSWDFLTRIGIISERFAENLFLSGNWNISWVLLIVSLIVWRRKIYTNFQARLFLLILILYFSFYFTVGLFTPSFVSIAGWHSGTVLSRLILHFFPLCPLLIIFLNCPKKVG